MQFEHIVFVYNPIVIKVLNIIFATYIVVSFCIIFHMLWKYHKLNSVIFMLIYTITFGSVVLGVAYLLVSVPVTLE